MQFKNSRNLTSIQSLKNPSCLVMSPNKMVAKPFVTNALSILQACIYKSVKTGLFLKPFIDTRVVKFNKMMPVFTFKYQDLWPKCMILWSQTTLGAKLILKILLFAQTCKQRPVKCLQHHLLLVAKLFGCQTILLPSQPTPTILQFSFQVKSFSN